MFLGKKAKVEDYSRLQDSSSAKSAGMFKKSEYTSLSMSSIMSRPSRREFSGGSRLSQRWNGF